ncbi:hypothetical protein ACVWZ6_008517 [Bradyrhizobium sp. GM6.1]
MRGRERVDIDETERSLDQQFERHRRGAIRRGGAQLIGNGGDVARALRLRHDHRIQSGKRSERADFLRDEGAVDGVEPDGDDLVAPIQRG